jgi:hypothetical protein
MSDRKWYETHDNLTGLANWLNCECCWFSDAAAVIYYFEKPWKWTREYELWQLAQRGFCTERCIEAVDDPRMTAEQLEAELEEEGAK